MPISWAVKAAKATKTKKALVWIAHFLMADAKPHFSTGF
jgi:hypothetical protein